MSTLSKLMSSAAVATLIAGSAAAQTSMDAGAQTGMEADVGVTSGDLGAAPVTERAMDDMETSATDPGMEGVAPPPAPETATPEGAMTAGVNQETDLAITTSAEALALGEPVTVFDSEGNPLGDLRSAGHAANGAAEFSIELNPALEADARRVTYRGTADLDVEGRLMLPLTTAEFTSRIMAQTGGAG